MLMWHDFFAAVALVLVIEGMIPFIKPNRWRQMVSVASKQSDEALRALGFFSMLAGVGMLYVVR